ncbi:MAG: hypothetical protein WC379_03855 [Methanoregula sp.]|jgi:hypothetical protein
MTARPIDPESWSRPVYAAVALVLVMVAVLLAAGCVSQPETENISPEKKVPAVSYTISSDLSASEVAYLNNLTPAQRKIPVKLLQIIDPNYPEFSRHFTMSNLVSYYFFPAENASLIFNISEKQARGHGGELLCEVSLTPSASSDVIDPIATRVDGKNERTHIVVAWIGLNELQDVASVPEVVKIREIGHATVYEIPPYGNTNLLGKIYPYLDDVFLNNYSENQKKHGLKQGSLSYFIPPENASQNFNISESTAQEHNGEISVTIHLQPPASLDIVDTFVTRIDSRDEEYYMVDAWVGLNNVEKIASLPEVVRIDINYPGIVGFPGEEGLNVTHYLNQSNNGILKPAT